MANSQSVDGPARFSEYGAQRGGDGVDIADVLMSLQSSGERRLSAQPQPQPQLRQQVQLQAQLEPQPQSEKPMEPQQASASQSCGKNVEVNFRDKGHIVTSGDGSNMNVYQKLEARRQTGGTARASGLEYDVRISEEGCSKTVAIDVFRREPIPVVLPARNGTDDCLWDRLYHHEMEHVRIKQTTPKSFESEIRTIAENSTNPRSEMVRLIWRIEKEIARRNDQFHQFESRISPPRGCKPTFRNMTW